MDNVDDNWDNLFVDLPSSLRSDVVQATHGKIIKGITFFKDKPQDFLINIIPKLLTLNLFDNDILFSQGDLAGELFFIFLGSIQLYIDLSELVDMTKKNKIINEDACFNIPLI